MAATLSLLLAILRLAAGKKADGNFWQKVDGKAMINNLLEKQYSVTSTECLLKCTAIDECKSINYLASMTFCELNKKDSRDSNVTIEERVGWAYYEILPEPTVDQSIIKMCLQKSPCKHGTCTDTSQDPRYKCTCHKPFIGTNCDISIGVGLNQETAAPSCLEIRNRYEENAPPSGMYWIMTTKPVQMYCDMSVDGGGWTKVANINNTSNSLEYSQSYFHDELETMGMIESPFYALSTSGLATLRQFINFTSIRIYCHKPSVNRTIHIVTANNSLGLEVVRYMTGNSIARPASCNSYVKMPDDDSIIARDCSRWPSQSWSISYAKSTELLYDLTAYVSMVSHISAGSNNQFKCDDMYGSKIGIWMFFVR